MTEQTKTTEFNATTVEEALEKAHNSLGVKPEDISYEVLDKGSSGFMGIGARDARISVTFTGTAKVDQGEQASETEQIANYESEPESQNVADEPSMSDQEPDLQSESSAPESTTQVPVSEELISDAHEYASRAADLMGLNARIEAYDAGEFVAVDVATEQAGLFIGQKGETIDALQYLLNVSVYRDREFSKRIVLDSEGYRQRRIEAIQGIAHRTARRAIREQRPLELPPMSPQERRIVHQYLQSDSRVTTSSEGRGESRKVSISPL